jgi:mono/diheme cytochrome c family protein
MRYRLLLAFAAFFLAAALAGADQPASKVVLPVGKTTPTDGRQMFASYCAPCHGIDGRGSGPLAPALRIKPGDLTLLSRGHHGRFPEAQVVTVLQFGAQTPHSAMEMPAWGPILAKMNQSNHQARLLRISNLSRYLDTIQVR